MNLASFYLCLFMNINTSAKLLWNAISWEKKTTIIIIHQTHYEKSDWSRAFNQFTIACELDMINAISAADIAFIMSSWALFLDARLLTHFTSPDMYSQAVFLFRRPTRLKEGPTLQYVCRRVHIFKWKDQN